MNRPKISEIKEVNLPKPEHITLANGANLYSLNTPSAEYFRFELVFRAGRYQENAPMTSKGCALMLKEGAGGLTSNELSEYFDLRGSSLDIRNSLDHLIISFVCIREYAHELVEMIYKVCFEPCFNRSDFTKMIRRQQKKLRNELSKSEVLAYREMTADIFGRDSPYGYNSTEEKYAALELNEVIRFHEKCIQKGSFQINVVGAVEQKLLHTISHNFGGHTIEEGPYTLATASFSKKVTTKHLLHRSGKQSSIRLYRPLFRRQHPDYTKMFVLNMILGGFFGSRLMKKIREKEGLTYGIYSSIDLLERSGYYYVSTETSPANSDKVTQLIRRELGHLCEHLISEEELLMVKRYTSGQFLRMVDGPLQVMKLHRSLTLDGLELNYFNQMLADIWVSSPQDLLNLAHQYLQPDEWSYLEVGPR